MQIFITIVILLVMLGILVSAHEAGHLVMAKSFNVYCLEYSIGFGPKLFSWKKKTGETRFSIRAFPLGGYVSMFGEGVELPEGVSVPPERSLNGVSAWKRSLILSAGILVNFFLSMVFVVIYATCIKSYYTSQLVYTGLDENGTVLTDPSAHGEIAYSFWVKGSVGTYVIPDDNGRVYSCFGFASGNSEYFVVDPEATITNGTTVTPYVACFTPSSLNDNDFLANLTFFRQREAFYPSALNKAMGLTAYPDVSLGKHALAVDDVLSMKVTFIGVDATEDRPLRTQFQTKQAVAYSAKAQVSDGTVSFPKSTLVNYSYQYYAGLGQGLKNACYYYSRYFTGIGEGFKAIFSFDFSNLGSVVAMGGVLNTESAQIGWGRTFFFYGGYLSLNLAIFNLLPFPGLDGWQLLVTVIESTVNGNKKKKWERQEKARAKQALALGGSTDTASMVTLSKNEEASHEYKPWKINDKIKNTVSAVGLALLFLFAIAITIKDIVSLFK
jgi:membrane-associated protease RseP (regulator of RpoE activity)